MGMLGEGERVIMSAADGTGSYNNWRSLKDFCRIECGPKMRYTSSTSSKPTLFQPSKEGH